MDCGVHVDCCVHVDCGIHMDCGIDVDCGILWTRCTMDCIYIVWWHWWGPAVVYLPPIIPPT